MSSPSRPIATGAGSVAPGEYSAAMGQHVASVCVITTAVDNQRFGLTATAVSSVCATPPRLLICVNKSGLTHSKIMAAGHFCVNVLAESQDAIAKAFAGMSGSEVDRFAIGEWSVMQTGSPALRDAAAVFDCRAAEYLDQFTHTVYFGDVVAVASQQSADSLLYGARRFRQLRKMFSSLEPGTGEMLHF